MYVGVDVLHLLKNKNKTSLHGIESNQNSSVTTVVETSGSDVCLFSSTLDHSLGLLFCTRCSARLTRFVCVAWSCVRFANFAFQKSCLHRG
ncbi:hypothetical protein AKJ16_DCAP26047 [Drosera capensis]